MASCVFNFVLVPANITNIKSWSNDCLCLTGNELKQPKERN